MRRRTFLPRLTAPIMLLVCAGLGGGRAEPGSPQAGERTPVVFVSGVTGTKLEDARTGTLIWGGVRQLILPHDGGYVLTLPLSAPGNRDEVSRQIPQARYEPIGPIWRLRFPGWTKEIYQPLRERFEEWGYRLGDLAAPAPGDGLFFFDYDWRYGNLDSVRLLDRRLTALSEELGGADIDLICQSNAAKICRWLAKYGTLDVDEVEGGAVWERSYRIRKLVLAGASNNGALRVLKLLVQGRSYIPLIGRRFYPETFFSIRPLFEDLPTNGDDLFFDETGRTVPVDLFDEKNWLEYGWSIFGREASGRLRRDPRTDLFGSRKEHIDYLERQLDHARRLQTLLARDSDQFPDVEYFLLENGSSPTIARALLTHQNGEWRTYFLGDRQVDRNPVFERLASQPGDGHAILSSQRGLSPQEAKALVRTVEVEGGHFEAIIQPDALDALLEFLATPVAAR